MELRLPSLVWANQTGWVSVPARRGERWYERWYEWPGDKADIESWLVSANEEADVYWSPLVYPRPSRREAASCSSLWAWADFDEVDPQRLTPAPSVLWATSPGRYQGLYRLAQPSPAKELEQINRAIALATGGDPSGWDAGQVLRVPGSKNHKYEGSPKGKLIAARKLVYRANDFQSWIAQLPPPPAALTAPTPTGDFAGVLMQYQHQLPSDAIELLLWPREEVVQGERSHNLWVLIRLLVGAGLPFEAVYVLAQGSPWNKFAGRHDEDKRLRQEISKAQSAAVETAVTEEEEITPQEEAEVAPQEPPKPLRHKDYPMTFAHGSWLDRYMRIATAIAPATPKKFHVIYALGLLSAACGRDFRLSEANQTFMPSFWSLIISPPGGGKGQALEFAQKVWAASALSPEIGSMDKWTPEGLDEQLTESPRHQVLLLSDEIGWFFKEARREHMASAEQQLAKLYDGRGWRRRTKKYIVDLPDAYVTLIGGLQPGIFRRYVTSEHIESGLMRRLFLCYDPDIAPFVEKREGWDYQEEIQQLGQELAEIHRVICSPPPSEALTCKGREVIATPERMQADIGHEAYWFWKSYQRRMYELASKEPELGGVHMERGVYALKIAMLLAVAERFHDVRLGGLEVREDDLRRAVAMLETEWRNTQHVVKLIGNDPRETLILDMLRWLYERGERTCTRTLLAQRFSTRGVGKKLLDELEETMVDRGYLHVSVKRGKGRPTKVYRINRPAVEQLLADKDASLDEL